MVCSVQPYGKAHQVFERAENRARHGRRHRDHQLARAGAASWRERQVRLRLALSSPSEPASARLSFTPKGHHRQRQAPARPIPRRSAPCPAARRCPACARAAGIHLALALARHVDRSRCAFHHLQAFHVERDLHGLLGSQVVLDQRRDRHFVALRKKRGTASRSIRFLRTMVVQVALPTLVSAVIAAGRGAPGGQRVGEVDRRLRVAARVGAQVGRPEHRVGEDLADLRLDQLLGLDRGQRRCPAALRASCMRRLPASP